MHLLNRSIDVSVHRQGSSSSKGDEMYDVTIIVHRRWSTTQWQLLICPLPAASRTNHCRLGCFYYDYEIHYMQAWYACAEQFLPTVISGLSALHRESKNIPVIISRSLLKHCPILIIFSVGYESVCVTYLIACLFLVVSFFFRYAMKVTLYKCVL